MGLIAYVWIVNTQTQDTKSFTFLLKLLLNAENSIDRTLLLINVSRDSPQVHQIGVKVVLHNGRYLYTCIGDVYLDSVH